MHVGREVVRWKARWSASLQRTRCTNHCHLWRPSSGRKEAEYDFPQNKDRRQDIEQAKRHAHRINGDCSFEQNLILCFVIRCTASIHRCDSSISCSVAKLIRVKFFTVFWRIPFIQTSWRKFYLGLLQPHLLYCYCTIFESHLYDKGWSWWNEPVYFYLNIKHLLAFYLISWHKTSRD